MTHKQLLGRLGRICLRVKHPAVHTAIPPNIRQAVAVAAVAVTARTIPAVCRSRPGCWLSAGSSVSREWKVVVSDSNTLVADAYWLRTYFCWLPTDLIKAQVAVDCGQEVSKKFRKRLHNIQFEEGP